MHFLSIEFWKSRLGLFPIPLLPKVRETKKYVLLNGGKSGDFCLDFENESSQISRQNAWSSNIGSYIILFKNRIKVYRWDKPSTIEDIAVKKIEGRVDIFYKYLRDQKVDSQYSSINFGLRLYKQIRTQLRDNDGADSLNVLLCLLASYNDDTSISELNITKWALSEHAKSRAKDIPADKWSMFLEKLDRGLPELKLKPNIDLLLRHAAGSLFQEAHFESVFPVQYQTELNLPGIEPKIEEPQKQLKQQSAHFTPTPIVRSIVEEVLRGYDYKTKKEISILDPACGSGEFLKEILRQLFLNNYEGKVTVIGWDISTSAIDLAKFSVTYEANSISNRVTHEIKLQDALTAGNAWDISADIILMNPPFSSWEMMKDKEQNAVREILGSLFSQRPNMAGAFLWKAANSLKEGGRIGCVLPASVLEADSFQKLRGELRSTISIDFIGKLGSHIIYGDAIAYTSLLIGTAKKVNGNSPLVMWSDTQKDSYSDALRSLRKLHSTSGDILDEKSIGKGFSIYRPDQLIDSNWTPIDLKAYELINFKLKKMPKVQDLFDVRQGARTGLNEAFIISKDYWSTLSNKEKKYFRPVVTNDSINLGQINDNYYIFYAEGKYAIKDERELKNAVPKFYEERFSNFISLLSTRARKDITNFWRLSEHRAWQVGNISKIVSKEFGRAGSFAFDREGIFVAERSHAWLPKNSESWGEIGHAYIAILTMDIINDLLNGLSKQLGGGYYYLSSKFINDMPIPDLFSNKFDSELRDELISMGLLLASGRFDDNAKKDLERLSKFVFRA